ncbi:MAG: 2-oxoglutarate ferredoxin oxidoreductase subunit alpha, partial [Planctomycetota bacterium]
DLLQVLYGRNGECPVPVVAPATPSECFTMAIEAVRIATRYTVPVFFLSDGYLANGAEPWRIPSREELGEIQMPICKDPEGYAPYKRNPETLARYMALPGTPGMEHRLGGLEKEDITGNVSYDPLNHEKMVHLRAEKVERIQQDIPPVEVFGQPEGDLLVVGWGGTYGAITSAVEQLQKEGHSVSSIHLRYLNPFPKNLEEVLKSFKKVLVCELNLGQLRFVLQGKFLIPLLGYSKVQGKPFKVAEIKQKILEILNSQS